MCTFIKSTFIEKAVSFVSLFIIYLEWILNSDTSFTSVKPNQGAKHPKEGSTEHAKPPATWVNVQIEGYAIPLTLNHHHIKGQREREQPLDAKWMESDVAIYLERDLYATLTQVDYRKERGIHLSKSIVLMWWQTWPASALWTRPASSYFPKSTLTSYIGDYYIYHTKKIDLTRAVETDTQQ